MVHMAVLASGKKIGAEKSAGRRSWRPDSWPQSLRRLNDEVVSARAISNLPVERCGRGDRSSAHPIHRL
jgi:hypothetical protein